MRNFRQKSITPHSAQADMTIRVTQLPFQLFPLLSLDGAGDWL